MCKIRVDVQDIEVTDRCQCELDCHAAYCSHCDSEKIFTRGFQINKVDYDTYDGKKAHCDSSFHPRTFDANKNWKISS
jgi:hypothetical protein